MTDACSEQTVRRHFRFSMRTMLIVVTVGCVVGGVYMWPILKQRKLAAYQAKWQALGAAVNERASCDIEVTELSIRSVHLSELPAEIWTLTNLRKLYLHDNQPTESPPETETSPKAATPTLTNRPSTEQSANPWLAFQQFKPPVYEDQLTVLPPEIGQLTNLTKLCLSSDQFVKLPPEIGKLTDLTMLDLQGNPITNSDLKYLKSLEKLRVLWLIQTSVTEEGVEKLRRTLPKCVIVTDFDSDSLQTGW